MTPIGWLHKHDPGFGAAKRALRAAVIVPVVFAIGSQVIGNAQVATFGAFGTFALLIFANFPGDARSRLGAYAALGVAGAVLISIGTLVATPDWLAVVAMAVIGFAVMFAGVLSSVLNGGTLAALLAFILAVMIPGTRSMLPDRLLGWVIALVLAVPAAVFVWPPTDRDVLRLKTAALCRSLAAMLRLEQPAPGAGDPLVAMRAARRELTEAFRTSAARTAALTTGARLVIRLADELEWLSTVVANACADAPEMWPEQGRRLRESAARMLTASADTLHSAGAGAEVCAALDACIADLAAARAAVAAEALAELRSSAGPAGAVPRGEFERPLYAAHELGAAVELVGRTVSIIAAADSRPWWARALGRPVEVSDPGVFGGARVVATGHLDRHSVWLQTSLRAAGGLALAVLFARIFDAQNSFWIVLGAISVLRSNAVSTGSTAVRALIGTTIGFAIGGALVAVLGTGHALLWTLLPIVIFVAASAQVVISFEAGQAAFTVFTIILFNIIAPAGWQIGVVRVEDVALGCLAGLVAGALFWPRGAGAALGAALGESYRASAHYLQQSVDAVTGRGSVSPDDGATATAAGLRLDDALRQYLAEQGAKHVALADVAALANGATRLRLAGREIANFGAVVACGPVVGTTLAAPARLLSERAATVTGWYESLAEGFEHADRTPALTADSCAPAGSFLEVVLPAVDGCGDEACAAHAEQLLWSGQYLGDVDRLRADLLEPASAVNSAQVRPWWRR